MKPKINPEIESYYLIISYLDHLSQAGQEFRKSIEMLPIFGFNNSVHFWEQLRIVKETLETAIDFQKPKFSKILNNDEYKLKTEKSISYIESKYLDYPNNGLTSKEKEYVRKGLKDFYQATEHSTIPFYNQYSATKDDRAAYASIAFYYALLVVYRLYELFSNGIEEASRKIEIVNKEMGFKVSKEPSPEELQEFYNASEKMKIFGVNFSFTPEAKKLLMNEQIFSGLFTLNLSSENFSLDNKALESNYIKLIFEQTQKSFNTLSLHRQYIIAGYISLSFKIIQESDWKPATSEYKTLTNFVRDRVKGIVYRS